MPIEMLKSIGCDYFDLNVQIVVSQDHLIVYSDVGLLETKLLQQNGANVKRKNWPSNEHNI
jgi:hypothetical protein